MPQIADLNIEDSLHCLIKEMHEIKCHLLNKGKEKQHYNTVYTSAVSATSVQSGCNAICFINLAPTDGSGATFTINNVLPIAPGASFNVDGNENEIDDSMYNLTFGTGKPLCVIVRKYFL